MMDFWSDSRVYVLRPDGLTQLTKDHSWVEEQVRAGTLTPDAARQHPWRNVVTRALSGGEDPDIDVVEIDPVPGERYLLCSDGLFGVVHDEQIAKIMSDRRAALEEICGHLIDAANDAGGPDNITAMLLQADAP
jgi:PPM family protein phosphatase